MLRCIVRWRACSQTDGIDGMTSLTDRFGVDLIEPDLLPNLQIRINEMCRAMLAPHYSSIEDT